MMACSDFPLGNNLGRGSDRSLKEIATSKAENVIARPLNFEIFLVSSYVLLALARKVQVVWTLCLKLSHPSEKRPTTSGVMVIHAMNVGLIFVRQHKPHHSFDACRIV